MLSNAQRSPGNLRVADLARRAGVTAATVRYYARLGLIHAHREPHNGYRRFSAEDVHRIEVIRRAQALGLTIADIKVLFEAIDCGRSPCGEVQDRVRGRLPGVRAQVESLQATEARMRLALAAWEQSPEPRPRAAELCPLIERFEVDNAVELAAQRRDVPPPVVCGCKRPECSVAAG